VLSVAKAAYFEIPPGAASIKKKDSSELEVQSIMLSSEPTSKEGRVLLTVFYCVKGANMPGLLKVLVDLDRSVEENLQEGIATTRQDKEEAILSTHITRIALNLLLYVSHPNEDFIEELNRFSTKRSKRDAEMKIYTDSPFIKIGFGEDFLRLIVSENVNVSDHFRWQPYGPKRSQVKLILIKAHQRVYKRPVLQEGLNEAVTAH
jgi:hypothetical protein